MWGCVVDASPSWSGVGGTWSGGTGEMQGPAMQVEGPRAGIMGRMSPGGPRTTHGSVHTLVTQEGPAGLN